MIEATFAREQVDASVSLDEGLPALLEIAHKLAQALEHLHHRGLVHGDLKPSNVILRDGREPLLIDFGLAKRVLGRERIDAAELAGGTYKYMSPEQIRGELTDAKSDLYSFGCLLYEMLSGGPPFSGDSRAILAAHLTESPRRLKDFCSWVHADVSDLVDRLLAKSPAARMPARASLAIELAAMIGSTEPEPTSLKPGYLGRSAWVGQGDFLIELVRTVSEPCVLHIVGPAGAGKTRIALELARVLRSSSVHVVVSSCSGTFADGGYARSALSALVPILERVARTYWTKPDASLARHGAELLGSYCPSFRAMGDGRVVGAETSASPPAASRSAVCAAALSVLESWASGAPTLIVFDDAEDIDDLSLAALARIDQAWLARANVRIMFLSRPGQGNGRVDELARTLRARRLDMPRLRDDEIGELLVAMGIDLFTCPFPDVPADSPDRYPIAVLEWARDVAEGAGVGALSSSMEAVLPRRLGRLPPLCTVLCHILSLTDQALPASALAHIADAPVDDVTLAATKLVSRMILEGDREQGYRFQSTFYRDAMQTVLSDSRRVELHRRLAEWGESAMRRYAAYPARKLGEHWVAACRPDRAVPYFCEAARTAEAGLAFVDAAELYDTSLALVDQHRLSYDIEELAEMLVRAAWARKQVGDHARATDALERALILLGDPPLGAEASTVPAMVWEGGRYAMASMLGAPFRRRHENRRRHLRAEAWLSLVDGYLYQQAFPRGVHAGFRGLRVARGQAETPRTASAYAMLGTILGLAKLTGASRRFCDRGLSVAEGTGDGSSVAYACVRSAVRALQQGEWRCAEADLGVGLDAALRARDDRMVEECHSVMGLAAYYQGRLLEGREHWQAVWDSARARRDVQTAMWATLGLAEGSIRAGDGQGALALLSGIDAADGAVLTVTDEFWRLGLSAAAQALVGKLEEAVRTARRAQIHAKSNPPVTYWSGLALMASLVVLSAGARGGFCPAAHARELGLYARVFGTLVPCYGPLTSLSLGLAALLAGRPRRAKRLADGSLRAAMKFGTPLEEAFALALSGMLEGGWQGVRRRKMADVILRRMAATGWQASMDKASTGTLARAEDRGCSR